MLSTLLASALTATLAPAPSDDQAFFAILAETKVGRMAGMPVLDLKDLPPGFKLPPQAMMFAGVASRILNVRLWSPGIAPASAKASVAIPSGLKQGPKMDLELYRPEAGKGSGTVQGFDPDSNPEGFTVKIYWGSSETVKPGQPKIMTWGNLTPEQKEMMKNRAREANAGPGSYYYKPDWTTGYWPTKSQPGNIDLKATLVGKYLLTTDYTGSVEIEAPSNVDFLAPIEMSSPDLGKKIDLKKAIAFEWKEIPNALGLQAGIVAMEGKNTMILWSASEVFTEDVMAETGFLQMAEVRDFVAKTLFMEGNRTKVTVPAGIFANADFAMMQMAGFGPGAALDKAQPLPRIQTKTSLMLMLGGKKMPGLAP